MENQFKNDTERIQELKTCLEKSHNLLHNADKMRLVHTGYGYDFYIGKDDKGKSFYNIIPMGENEPTSGYYNSEWISKMKGVKNVFKTVEKEHDEIKKSIMDKLKDNGF
jgi:hypothetical protein